MTLDEDVFGEPTPEPDPAPTLEPASKPWTAEPETARPGTSESSLAEYRPDEFRADGRRRPLDPAFVPAERMGNAIGLAVLGVLSAIFAVYLVFLADAPRVVRLGLSGLLVPFLGFIAWFSFSWPPRQFARTRWRVDDEGMEIERGVVWRSTISVPRARIQHTDVSQGPLQRHFGLAKLVIHTAGTHDSQIELSGLSREMAFEVRNELLRKAAGGRTDAV